jgi:hypothetical protein
VDGVPALLVAGHQRQPGHQRAQVDVVAQHHVDQALVRAAQRGHGGHHPAVTLGQRGHDLLGQEVVDRGASPGGAELGQGRPPAQVGQALPRQAAEGGELGQLVLAEGQVALAQALDLTLGRQPRERQRGLRPPAEHHVAVGQEALDQPGEHGRPGRAAPDLVHVVEHQAHVAGRQPPQVAGQQRAQRVGVELARLVHLGQVGAERVGQSCGQTASVVVARPPPEPAVDAARSQRVLVDGLNQQDRLAEPGACDDHRHLTIPAPLEPAQQAAAPDQGSARA